MLEYLSLLGFLSLCSAASQYAQTRAIQNEWSTYRDGCWHYTTEDACHRHRDICSWNTWSSECKALFQCNPNPYLFLNTPQVVGQSCSIVTPLCCEFTPGCSKKQYGIDESKSSWEECVGTWGFAGIAGGCDDDTGYGPPTPPPPTRTLSPTPPDVPGTNVWNWRNTDCFGTVTEPSIPAPPVPVSVSYNSNAYTLVQPFSTSHLYICIPPPEQFDELDSPSMPYSSLCPSLESCRADCSASVTSQAACELLPRCMWNNTQCQVNATSCLTEKNCLTAPVNGVTAVPPANTILLEDKATWEQIFRNLNLDSDVAELWVQHQFASLWYSYDLYKWQISFCDHLLQYNIRQEDGSLNPNNTIKLGGLHSSFANTHNTTSYFTAGAFAKTENYQSLTEPVGQLLQDTTIVTAEEYQVDEPVNATYNTCYEVGSAIANASYPNICWCYQFSAVPKISLGVNCVARCSNARFNSTFMLNDRLKSQRISDMQSTCIASTPAVHFGSTVLTDAVAETPEHYGFLSHSSWCDLTLGDIDILDDGLDATLSSNLQFGCLCHDPNTEMRVVPMRGDVGCTEVCNVTLSTIDVTHSHDHHGQHSHTADALYLEPCIGLILWPPPKTNTSRMPAIWDEYTTCECPVSIEVQLRDAALLAEASSFQVEPIYNPNPLPLNGSDDCRAACNYNYPDDCHQATVQSECNDIDGCEYFFTEFSRVWPYIGQNGECKPLLPPPISIIAPPGENKMTQCNTVLPANLTTTTSFVSYDNIATPAPAKSILIGAAVCVPPPADIPSFCPGYPDCRYLSVQGGFLQNVYSVITDGYPSSTNENGVPTCERQANTLLFATDMNMYNSIYNENITQDIFWDGAAPLNGCNLATRTSEECTQVADMFNAKTFLADVLDNGYIDTVPRGPDLFTWCRRLGSVTPTIESQSPGVPDSLREVLSATDAPLQCGLSVPDVDFDAMRTELLRVLDYSVQNNTDPCLCTYRKTNTAPLIPGIIGLISPEYELIPGVTESEYNCGSLPECNKVLTSNEKPLYFCECNNSVYELPFAGESCDDSCEEKGLTCTDVVSSHHYYNVSKIVFDIQATANVNSGTQSEVTFLRQGSLRVPPFALLGYTASASQRTVLYAEIIKIPNEQLFHEQACYRPFTGQTLDLTELFVPKDCHGDDSDCYQTQGVFQDDDDVDGVELCQLRCITVVESLHGNSQYEIKVSMDSGRPIYSDPPQWSIQGSSDFKAQSPQICLSEPRQMEANLKYLGLMARSLYRERLMETRILVDEISSSVPSTAEYKYWATWLEVTPPIDSNIEVAQTYNPCIATVIPSTATYVPQFKYYSDPGNDHDTYFSYLNTEDSSFPEYIVYSLPTAVETLLHEILDPHAHLLYPKGRLYTKHEDEDEDEALCTRFAVNSTHALLSSLIETPDRLMLMPPLQSPHIEKTLACTEDGKNIYYIIEMTMMQANSDTLTDENRPCYGPSQMACEDIEATLSPETGVYENVTCTNYPMCGFKKRLPTNAPTRSLPPNGLTFPPTQADGSTAAVVGVNRDAFLGSITAAISILAITLVVITALKLYRQHRDGRPRSDYDDDSGTEDEEHDPLLPPPYSAKSTSTAAFM